MTTHYKDWRSVEVPKIMRTLRRDARGYPVPCIVMDDTTGKPVFTVNEHEKVVRCARKSLCAICGKKIPRHQRWLVGGAKLFTDFRAAFLDPPVHRECAEYALKVCPYLANPSFNKEIGAKLLGPGKMPADRIVTTEDTPVLTTHGKPHAFAMGLAVGFNIIERPGQSILMTVDSWQEIHYWKDGQGVPDYAHDAA